jgi:CubicO group peptidase (beta-lactamase class C family)
VRQLLSHQAGFEGDIFTETGTGEDCVEKYLPVLAGVEQLFEPGEMFSYNNAGFVVLGRLVEVLREKPYDQCLRDHIVTPLGLTHVASGAGEAILHRAAVGHIQPKPDADPEPAPVWSMMRSMVPAGSTLAMRPRDLLTFARLHLNGGETADGTRVLSAAGVKAMQERQVSLPPGGMMGTSWGLGWELFDLPGATMIGHDGGTIGQAAFLRVVPGQDASITLLTNGGDVIGLYLKVVGHLLREVAGLELPPMPVPPAEPVPVDATRYVGTYSSEVSDLVVSQDDDGRLWLTTTIKGALAGLGDGAEPVELVGYDGDALVTLEPQNGMHQPHNFLGDDGTGRALYLYNGRATRRADS